MKERMVVITFPSHSGLLALNSRRHHYAWMSAQYCILLLRLISRQGPGSCVAQWLLLLPTLSCFVFSHLLSVPTTIKNFCFRSKASRSTIGQDNLPPRPLLLAVVFVFENPLQHCSYREGFFQVCNFVLESIVFSLNRISFSLCRSFFNPKRFNSSSRRAIQSSKDMGHTHSSSCSRFHCWRCQSLTRGQISQGGGIEARHPGNA
jgi:hypothetical protein